MPPLPLVAVFADVPDPRRDTANKRHALTDVLVLATGAIIGGAGSWDSIAHLARWKEDVFRRVLPLGNGIPGSDTFERVFAKLNPTAFAAALGRWMTAALGDTGMVPIAIDGKSVKASEKATNTGCLHPVSARATARRLTPGQVSVPEGSNEIAAIPELLAVLELTGAVVTLDAAGCRKAIARQIRDRGGDYRLAVKGNQPTLRAAVGAAVDRACATDLAAVAHDQHAEAGGGHGRHEERYTTAILDPVGMPDEWPDVAAVVPVSRERTSGGKTTSKTHYDVTGSGPPCVMSVG